MTDPQAPPWRGLAFVALGVSMIMLDTTIVNVALPWMAFDLGFTTGDTQWVVAAYALAFAALLIAAGRIADTYGRRRLFQLGVAMFAMSSAWIGWSGSTASVVGGRFLQGAGAAMIMPSSLSLINTTFMGRHRATAFAVWGGAIGGMAAVGPLVGGWLTTTFSWHWAFFVNVPVACAVFVGIARTMPESRDAHAVRGTDAPGILLSASALGLLVFALIEGQYYGWLTARRAFPIGSWEWPGGGTSVSLIAAALGVIALALFLRVERSRRVRELPVLVDVRLFSIPSFRNGNVVAVIVSLGEFGLLYVLPLFVQGSLGYDPLQSGTLLLALAVGSFGASAASTRLADRMGPVRVLQIGMGLEALGIAVIGVVLSTHSTLSVIAPGLFVYGLGIGFATAQLTSVILRDVPPEVSGQASAIQSTARQMGAAMGTAILGAALAVVTYGEAVSRFTALGVTPKLASDFGDFITETAGQLIQFLILQPKGQQMVDAGHAAFALGTKSVAALATAFVLLGLAASLRLRADESATQQVE